MKRPPLLGCSALLLAVTPAAARACSLSGFPMVQTPRGAHLIATAGRDTLLAGPGGVRYQVSPGHFGPAGERAVYGQVVEVERIGGPAARGLDPSVRRVVLVPWDYGADCRTTPWTASARWVEPGARGLFTATLRDPAHWAGGLPTFDVHTPGSEPYPQRAGDIRDEDEPRDSLLSVEDYFSVVDLLPVVGEADLPAADAYGPLFRWAEQRPELARRYPASEMLAAARYSVDYERLRSISPPLAGTYRFEARLGDEAPRVFYARTRTRPTTWWHVGPRRPDGEEEDAGGAEGYHLLSAGALLPDSLPVDCGPARRMEREGYLAMLKDPDADTDGRTWRGKIEVGLVAAQFPADSALRRFMRADEERFGRRYDRGEPDETPARFVLSPDGAVRVEQTIRLDDGRTLRLSGTRISLSTIAEPR